MPIMNIVLDGEGALEGFPKEKIICVKTPITVTSLASGMKSGAASVAFIIDLPDGRKVFAETSLKLFIQAAEAFNARHGDGRHRLSAATENLGGISEN